MVLSLVIASAFIVYYANPEIIVNPIIFYIGLIIFIIGFLFELIGDYQLGNFKKSDAKPVLDSGL